ncbi:MAG: GDP-mannose 4,6-dehydratase [Vicinamibacterales bacterium]
MTPDIAPWATPASVVLVTGASGFAGRHLLERLAPSPARVVAWGRRLPASAAAGTASTWVPVEVRDRSAVRRAIAAHPPTHVFHLAGSAHAGNSWHDPTEPLATNVIGTHHVLESLAAEAPGARVVVAASAMVYAPSDAVLSEASALRTTNPYALSKLAQEELSRVVGLDLGLDIVIARAFNHVGPGQAPTFFASSFARQLALIERGGHDAVLAVGNLDARRDLMDVRDTVRAYDWLMAAGHAGEAYNVCSGTAHSIGDVLRRLVALSGLDVEVRTDPAKLRPNDTPLVLGSAARLAQLTGWRPTFTLDSTLGDLLDDWRRRLADESAPSPS